MDLKTLPQELRTGVRIPTEDDKRVVVVFPIFRADFVTLKVPKASKSDPTRKNYGVRALFNFGDPQGDAFVDLKPVVVPAITEVATANRLNPKGWLRMGNEPKLEREDGTFPNGYGPHICFCSINTAGQNEDGSLRPPPPFKGPDPTKPLDASVFKSGFYGRAVVSIYYAPHGGGKVCFGLEEFQAIAKGELLGGYQSYEGTVGAIAGDTFEQPKPTQFPSGVVGGVAPPPEDDDDIPF